MACSFQKFSAELEHGSLENAEKSLMQLTRELLTMELWASCLLFLYLLVCFVHNDIDC